MKRNIIKIDEDKCNGCGLCIPSCAEGALQLIDGKARLISDLFCDGLGACIGDCPQGAISIEEREAEPYDEIKVMETIVKGGPEVIRAHLKHMKAHNEMQYFNLAIDYLKNHNIPIPLTEEEKPKQPGPFSCPGLAKRTFNRDKQGDDTDIVLQSKLTHWPIQMHLIQPGAGHFRNSDFILAADCCSYAYANFHNDFLKNSTLAIACPKLDTHKEVYLDKLVSLIDDAHIRSLTIVIMEVPCCRGLLVLAQEAVKKAKNEIPLKTVIIGIEGDIKKQGY